MANDERRALPVCRAMSVLVLVVLGLGLAAGSAEAQPTATPTPVLPPLNHFQCYGVKHPPVRIFGVTLDDAIGPGVVDLKKRARHCAPADKNDEDPTAPTDLAHLGSFTVKQTSPRFTRVLGVEVTNQLGVQLVDLLKPDRALVPTAVSTTSTPPLPPSFEVDHFKCYKVKGKLRAFGITVDDQFGSRTVDIKKPTHLCLPADKNGEGIPDLTQNLMCYQVKALAPPPSMLFIIDQFGPDVLGVTKPTELCVPSTVRLP